MCDVHVVQKLNIHEQYKNKFYYCVLFCPIKISFC